jgi:hypothetical protein
VTRTGATVTTADTADARPAHPEVDDPPASSLDDEADRDELRRRYYGLLQELRVLLPGVQILVAFLLTAPFASRFGALDRTEKLFYGLALSTGILAIVAFAAPIAMHRVGARRSRVERLLWGIRMLRVGLVLMALSLTTATLVIALLVYGRVAAALAGAGLVVALVATWVSLPMGAGRRARRGRPPRRR